jgi:hypothetical protein
LFFLNTLRTNADTYHDTVVPFLEEYCIQCHGQEKQKGDRRYDNLRNDFLDQDALILWQDIADLLNLGDMPPEEENQPNAEDRLAVVNWITDELTVAYEHHKSSDRKTVLRRLNRYEYNRTVRDLLHLQPLLIDPTESFPPDETEENFNNIGSALITSDFLLQGYLDAAESYIEQATRQGPEPEIHSYQFNAPFYTARNRWDGKDVAGKFQHIRKNTTDQDGFLWLEKLEQGVPESGYYKLRFKAQAINRDYPYPEKIVGTRKSEPLRVDVIAGSREYGELEFRTSSDRKVELSQFARPSSTIIRNTFKSLSTTGPYPATGSTPTPSRKPKRDASKRKPKKSPPLSVAFWIPKGLPTSSTDAMVGPPSIVDTKVPAFGFSR